MAEQQESKEFLQMDSPKPEAIGPQPMSTLIATDPQQLAVAQTELKSWYAAKVADLKRELADAKAEQKRAKERKWRLSGWLRVIESIEGRIDFYTKSRLAVEAGFLLIPNLPLNIFAVRTEPDAELDTLKYTSKPRGQQDVYPGNLPAGVGEYFSPTPHYRELHEADKDRQGQPTIVTRWQPAKLRKVVFPSVLAVPRLIDRVKEAMALRAFDQIGLVGRQRQADPIVAGQILDPESIYWPRATFFIAWWTDPNSL